MQRACCKNTHDRHRKVGIVKWEAGTAPPLRHHKDDTKAHPLAASPPFAETSAHVFLKLRVVWKDRHFLETHQTAGISNLRILPLAVKKVYTGILKVVGGQHCTHEEIRTASWNPPINVVSVLACVRFPGVHQMGCLKGSPFFGIPTKQQECEILGFCPWL